MDRETNLDVALLDSLSTRYGPTSVQVGQFYVSWQSVITLAYDSFSRTLLNVKKHIESGMQGQLAPENDGSKWPKTTLGCLCQDRALTDQQVNELRKLCIESTNELRRLSQDDLRVSVGELEVVVFRCRTLECRLLSIPIKLNGAVAADDTPPGDHIEFVRSVMAQFDQGQHEQYYPRLEPKGRTLEEYYREDHVEATLIANVSLSKAAAAIVDRFKQAVDHRLPQTYGWFEPDSWHVTVRALAPKRPERTVLAVSNNKVAGFQPLWAEFRGFSWLFDNPGRSFRREGEVEEICCAPAAEAKVAFYGRLQEALSGIGGGLLTNRYLFCPLPTASYHVTACDGVDVNNLAAVKGEGRASMEAFLRGLPSTLSPIPPGLQSVVRSASEMSALGRISFAFDKLTIWGNKVMVARLKATEESAEALRHFKHARQELGEQMRKDFGIKTWADYSPHVSLGYFADTEHARPASLHLPEWTKQFHATVGTATISFESVNLYGFTNMATFFRRPAQD